MKFYRKCPTCLGVGSVSEYERGPNATHSTRCPTCDGWRFVYVAEALVLTHVERAAIKDAIRELERGRDSAPALVAGEYKTPIDALTNLLKRGTPTT